MNSFTGKVALVTGGGSGIGAAVARSLAAEGASVVVSDLRLEAAQAISEEIVAEGGVAAPFAQDTTKPEQCQAAVAFAIDTFGGLHHAVNNAGIAIPSGPAGEVVIDDWAKIVDVNLNGVMYSLRYQLPAMEAGGGGSIVNLASMLGSVGTKNGAAYVSSKHGVVGLTKSAALDYATKGIRINSVGPGYIATPMMNTANDDKVKLLISKHPMGRLGTAGEVADLVTFLLSDKASFITGSFHRVDGGYTAQ